MGHRYLDVRAVNTKAAEAADRTSNAGAGERMGLTERDGGGYHGREILYPARSAPTGRDLALQI